MCIPIPIMHVFTAQNQITQCPQSFMIFGLAIYNAKQSNLQNMSALDNFLHVGNRTALQPSIFSYNMNAKLPILTNVLLNINI